MSHHERGRRWMSKGMGTPRAFAAAWHGGRLVCTAALALVLVLYCGFAAQARALTAGRTYEMVSPPYKGGYPVADGGIEAVAPDGESVLFESVGSFAGAPEGLQETQAALYYAHREPLSGWATAPDMVPAAISTHAPVEDFSPSLELQVAQTKLGANSNAVEYSREGASLLHRPGSADTLASWEEAGGFVLEPSDGSLESAFYEGASPDLCHILFSDRPLSHAPAAGAKQNQLYDLARGCAGEQPSLTVAAVDNSGHEVDPNCSVTSTGLDPQYAEATGQTNYFNAVAAGGSEVFFTTCTRFGPPGTLHQLFVRLGTERTLEVSRPLGACVGEEPPHAVGEVPCQGAGVRASANFQGASEDGSRVFFTTTTPLVGTDKDAQNDLYMATIGCPGGGEGCKPGEREVTSLTQVSKSLGAEAADVQGGVTVMSPDASRVYFVARGVLSEEGPNGGGVQERPVAGADNLYVYDVASKTTSFIADVCSDSRASGVVGDVRCPTDLTSFISGSEHNDGGLMRAYGAGRNAEAQVAGDGRFLVFSTFAQLTADDVDNARDVYRYDAQTRSLVRVSVGEGGYHQNGNGEDGEQNANASIAPNDQSSFKNFSQRGMNSRAVSEDGSRVVFRTAEPLSPAAVNGHVDVYEWHEGSVSLISSGTAEEDDSQVVMTPSGRDVFFLTSAELAPQDLDGVSDVYDARLEGGFPPPQAPREPCSGDACQGPLTNPAPLLVPGSVPQAPGENVAALVKVTPRALSRAQQLARALRACSKKPKGRRAACRRAAQKRYAKAARSVARGRR
jgi:hypothetical protein